MDAEKRDAVAVFDLVQWTEPIAGTVPVQYEHRRAVRGTRISLSDSEFERLAALGAIARPAVARQALEATTDVELTGPLPEGEEGDAILTEASATSLIGYVTQNPSEAERVARIEKARKTQRATVLRAAGIDPDTGEQLEPAGAVDDDTVGGA